MSSLSGCTHTNPVTEMIPPQEEGKKITKDCQQHLELQLLQCVDMNHVPCWAPSAGSGTKTVKSSLIILIINHNNHKA